MADVVLSGVTKTFGGKNVVDAVDLNIRNGEFTVFVGPSGCGKSTTLRMVAGLETVSSGSIRIGGRDVTDLEPKDRNIAMVFQNYALYPHKTVYDNLGFGLKMRKLASAEIDGRVRRAAAILGIEELLQRKPKQLSGGQMQRVALGRALVREPDVFLLDEPLSNLDAKMRVRMREEIGKLHREIGVSMIYVTHDQVEAMTLGDRIVVMRDGVVQQVGRPLEVYDRPANAFVGGFIGSPEMNLIRGRLASGDGGPRFEGTGLKLSVPEGFNLKSAGELLLGVRPEHLSMAADGESAETGGEIRMEIDLVEQMGAQTLVLGSLDGTDVKAVLNRDDRLRAGQSCVLKIEPERLHLFDAVTGQSLREA